MHKIAVIPGDGIGPEVITEGMRILGAAAKKCGTKLEFEEFPWGAKHYLKTGEILPPGTLEKLKSFSAIYLGAIGDPRIPGGILERGIVGVLRWDLDLFVNLRPLRLYHERYSPLKNIDSFDILVVRENTEDVYTGPSGFIHKNTPEEMALGVAFYSRKGVERILRYAFEAAMGRRKKLTLCDKANAISAQELWRRLFEEIGKEYPQVEREMIYVDACAMAFVRRPKQFDVIVTTNLFGDILTDLGAELCGGIGLAASGNIHPGKLGMFEPIHGSAPKYAGKKSANPLGSVLAGSMMMDYLGEKKCAALIEDGVRKVLESGKLKSLGTDGGVATSSVADLVLEAL